MPFQARPAAGGNLSHDLGIYKHEDGGQGRDQANHGQRQPGANVQTPQAMILGALGRPLTWDFLLELKTQQLAWEIARRKMLIKAQLYI